MSLHSKTLAVQNSKGKMIACSVLADGSDVRITTEPVLEAIGESDFSPEGVLTFSVSRAGYPGAITALEKYLESLVLRSMSNENRNPSVKRGAVATGPREEPVSASPEPDQREEDPPVDSGGDRHEPTPRPKRKRKPAAVVAEEGDPSIEISIEGGDEDVPGPREGDE